MVAGNAPTDELRSLDFNVTKHDLYTPNTFDVHVEIKCDGVLRFKITVPMSRTPGEHIFAYHVLDDFREFANGLWNEYALSLRARQKELCTFVVNHLNNRFEQRSKQRYTTPERSRDGHLQYTVVPEVSASLLRGRPP